MAKLNEVKITYGRKASKYDVMPTRSAGRNQQTEASRNSFTYQCMNDILTDSNLFLPETEIKRPSLRPSGFPVCAIHHFIALVQYSNAISLKSVTPAYTTPHGLFFTTVGTGVHSVLQAAFVNSPRQASKLWGNFICMNPSCKHRIEHSIRPLTCPSCGFGLMVYEEVEVSGRVGVSESKLVLPKSLVRNRTINVPIKGHVDTILRKAANAYIPVDYKTTSVTAINTHLDTGCKFPYQHNVEQVETYASMLSKQFDLPITDTSLVYVARDLVSNYVVSERPFGGREHRRIAYLMELYASQVYIAELAYKLYRNRSPIGSLLLNNRLCAMYDHNGHKNVNSQPVGLAVHKHVNSDSLKNQMFHTITDNHNSIYAPSDIRHWKACPFLSICSHTVSPCKQPKNNVSLFDDQQHVNKRQFMKLIDSRANSAFVVPDFYD